MRKVKTKLTATLAGLLLACVTAVTAQATSAPHACPGGGKPQTHGGCAPIPSAGKVSESDEVLVFEAFHVVYSTTGASVPNATIRFTPTLGQPLTVLCVTGAGGTCGGYVPQGNEHFTAIAGNYAGSLDFDAEPTVGQPITRPFPISFTRRTAASGKRG